MDKETVEMVRDALCGVSHIHEIDVRWLRVRCIGPDSYPIFIIDSTSYHIFSSALAIKSKYGKKPKQNTSIFCHEAFFIGYVMTK